MLKFPVAVTVLLVRRMPVPVGVNPLPKNPIVVPAEMVLLRMLMPSPLNALRVAPPRLMAPVAVMLTLLIPRPLSPPQLP